MVVGFVGRGQNFIFYRQPANGTAPPGDAPSGNFAEVANSLTKRQLGAGESKVEVISKNAPTVFAAFFGVFNPRFLFFFFSLIPKVGQDRLPLRYTNRFAAGLLRRN